MGARGYLGNVGVDERSAEEGGRLRPSCCAEHWKGKGKEGRRFAEEKAVGIVCGARLGALLQVGLPWTGRPLWQRWRRARWTSADADVDPRGHVTRRKWSTGGACRLSGSAVTRSGSLPPARSPYSQSPPPESTEHHRSRASSRLWKDARNVSTRGASPAVSPHIPTELPACTDCTEFGAR